jgi:acyl-CoA thioesterase FadM
LTALQTLQIHCALLYNEIVSKLARFLGPLFIVFSLLVVNGGPVAAQGGSASNYFADTGHNVTDAFWVYYQSIPNASWVFGSPITEAFSDMQTGRLIQYFQRARFEYFPDNPYGQQVRLSPLGEYVYQRTLSGTKLDFFPTIGCRYYTDTNFYICYDFLEFFDKNGGEAVFGKPKSGFEFYNGRIVQYFECARFEWYPEFPAGQKVVLAELGRVYFDMVSEDANLLQPVKPADTTTNSGFVSVMALYTKAFTWKAVTQLNDQQSVYVVVQDQTLRPVQGATAIVTIFWPVGGNQSFAQAQTTNEYGVVIVPFQVQGQPYGSIVTIQVEVLYQGLPPSKTITSFRIWQ